MKQSITAVWDWIDQNREEARDLLVDLVKIPSVNRFFEEDENLKKEGDVQRYLKSYLEKMGLDSEFSTPDPVALKKYEGKPGYYADHTFDDRPNLHAEWKGEGGGRSILLSGHVDVVQRGAGWTAQPFGAEIVGDTLYGRGSVDMKGGLAAMITAVKAIRACGIRLKGDVKIGTVVDEEAGSMGTLAYIDKGYRADACIITEPTSLKIAPMCRGILWGKLIIKGRPGHIELSDVDWRQGGAVDAIDKAQLFLDAFRRKNKEWSLTRTHKYLPVPCRILVAQLTAGEYPTSYAGSAEIVFNAQYLPREKDENGLGSWLKKEILDYVAQVSATDEWLRDHPPVIEWIVDADCAEVDDADPFMHTLKGTLSETGMDYGIEGLGCHTDIGFFSNIGIPTINLGPGSTYVAHQADEHIDLKEVYECAKLLAAIVINWCGEAERG